MRTFVALLCVSFAFGCSTTAPTPSVQTAAGQIAVTIKGDVHHPGRYFLAQGASLTEALHQAGGFTDFAYLKKLKITHRDGTVVYCNFQKDGGSFVMADEDAVFVDTISGSF